MNGWIILGGLSVSRMAFKTLNKDIKMTDGGHFIDKSDEVKSKD